MAQAYDAAMIAALDYFRVHAVRNDDGTYIIDESMMNQCVAALADTPTTIDLAARMLSAISPHSREQWRTLIRAIVYANMPPPELLRGHDRPWIHEA